MKARHLFLYDDGTARGWLPFSVTRPIGEMLYGTRTLRARAERHWGVRCEGHLAGERLLGFAEEGAPPCIPGDQVGAEGGKLVLCSRFAAAGGGDPVDFREATVLLAEGGSEGARTGTDGPTGDGEPVGAWIPDGTAPRRGLLEGDWSRWEEWRSWPSVAVAGELIESPWMLMRGNPERIAADAGSFAPSDTPAGVVKLGHAPLCIGDGAVVEPGSVIDTTGGPVLLGEGARIMAPCRVGGPAYIGAHSVLLGGALTASSIGPRCKVRGETESSIVLGYSNKAHDGFLGHAVLGRWVNLGALTTNSDLKNSYGSVRSQAGGRRVETGLTKAGCLIGDHVRTGIGTLLDTGAVVGAGSNVFGGMLAPKEVPPLSWCGPEGVVDYEIERFLETAERVMARRGREPGEGMRKLYRRVFRETGSQRGGEAQS